MAGACRVSFVVTTRNDGFGGGMLDRLRAFIEVILTLGERHGLDGEIIVVEWNPPDGPRLADDLELRVTSDRIPVRFIEVPEEIHLDLRNSDQIPLYQMIAKNVGIRRARGEYVIATNQDILFSDSLIEFLAKGELDPDAMYRIDRADIPAELPEAPIDELMAWCESNLIRIHKSYGSFDLSGPGRKAQSPLGLAWRGVTRMLRPPTVKGRSAADLARGAVHRIGGALRVTGTGLRHIGERMRAGSVHTNGCGDFTMLSRDRWRAARGYAEIPLWSMHLDSLLCWQAVAEGAHQVLLQAPHRTYHIEHGHSWVVMDWRDKLETFVKKPWLDISVVNEVRGMLLAQTQVEPLNADAWGYGDESLTETEIRGGAVRSVATRIPKSDPLSRRVASVEEPKAGVRAVTPRSVESPNHSNLN